MMTGGRSKIWLCQVVLIFDMHQLSMRNIYVSCLKILVVQMRAPLFQELVEQTTKLEMMMQRVRMQMIQPRSIPLLTSIAMTKGLLMVLPRERSRRKLFEIRI
uniref:Uncharacterized protein n=1 Tax=Arundo donax TaxID=35708 RepID=A0A0A8YL36_ARUDO